MKKCARSHNEILIHSNVKRFVVWALDSIATTQVIKGNCCPSYLLSRWFCVLFVVYVHLWFFFRSAYWTHIFLFFVRSRSVIKVFDKKKKKQNKYCVTCERKKEKTLKYVTDAKISYKSTGAENVLANASDNGRRWNRYNRIFGKVSK